MNTAQLAAAFNAHKPVVLGGAAAAVAGLAVLQKRKKATGTTATTSGATARTAGATVPAAAVVSGSGYDSTSTDLANYFGPQLEQILQQTSRSGITSAPAPVASTLFAPSGTGKLLQYDNGVYELENDGSLFGVTMDQWQQQQSAGAALSRLSGTAPTTAGGSDWNTKANIATRMTGQG